jgi:predicted membrane-bound mannosyltransferase
MVAMVIFIAFGVSAYQTIDLNFINYDNDKTYYVYVYAHTRRGTLDLVRNIEQIAAERDGKRTGITIVSPDYWPLPWYLRNFTRTAYFGTMAASTEPMIIAREDQKEQIDANFGELYRQVPSSDPSGSFELRPGVRLLLYVRRNQL